METTLLIMAAGIGSRFGTGIKQLEPVDDANHIIMDYSIHDAIEAGFNHVVFIIRKDIEKEFKEVIGDRIASICSNHNVTVDYAFQDINDIPGELPAGRTKPWGTGQAVLAAKEVIDTPFIKNTLSDHGGVTRGICSVEDGKLTGIAETKNIVKTVNGAEADGKPVDLDSLVSMNFWCYPASFMEVLKAGFPEFLKNMKDENKDEYLLPIIADGMLKEGTEFTVLPTDDHWFGVTYQEDRPVVEAAFRNLIEDGEYKADLYSDL